MAPAPKVTSVLHRGSACLPCRKKKMRCDATRPSCGQCAKSIRPQDCVYEDLKKKSRTQSLKEKVAALEERLKELEPQDVIEEAQIGIRLSPQPFSPERSSSFPGGTAWSPGSFSATPSSAPSSEEWFYHGATLLSPAAVSPLRTQEAPCDINVDVIPWETKILLLDIFLSRHQQLGFHVNVHKFKSSLSVGLNGTMHPALLNAMYIFGCHFSQSTSLLELKHHFLEKALHFLAEGIQSSDNLLHIIQASCLLSLYFFTHCRLLEAYQHAACAATMATSLGIHKWKASALKSSGIICTSDETDLPECLAAFWQSFVLCYTLSGLARLPALSMHAIQANDIEKPIIAALIPPVPNVADQTFDGTDLWSIPSLHGLFLRANATALFHRSFLVALPPTGPPSAIEQELDQLLACLPPILHGSRPGMDTFTVLALGNAIRINLYKNVPGQRHDRCRNAAYDMAFATELLRDEDYIHVDPVVSVCMAMAARVFLLLLPEDRPPRMFGYNQSLHVLVTALRRLGLVFPLATYYADSVQKEWIVRAGKASPFASESVSVVDFLHSHP
ncbi:hypothetical protein NEOLEDRAFT_495944 [Neolentinus lepideus HHB14362 ss-1]|uniref:Zn(2)-C6 fungal-type domain-containing protein n=1 Tax=Neolentinus lepideus HHB14362 ss-1 TaxID=1314782 RepID=A0A165RMZ3_9AGAM|nr:hypothetical protein NEOLEDRAFT_495944 [Neolentinus lepideus HHB14362 ss-1]